MNLGANSTNRLAALNDARTAVQMAPDEAAYRELATLEQRRDRLAEETREIGLSGQALVKRKQALVDAEIAARQAHIQRIEGLPAYAEETAALQRQVEVLRQIRSGVAANADAKAAQAERDEIARRAKSIEDSIYDGIANGFREGRRPMDIFLREFQAQAARTLLRVPVQFISQAAANLNGSLSSLFSFLGGSGGGGGGGDYGGLIPATPSVPGLALPAGASGGRVVAASRSTGGGQVVFAPAINIDARTDRAEVHALVVKASRAAMAEFVDNLDR